MADIEYQRAWRAKNSERINANKREWRRLARLNDPEGETAKRRAHWIRHRDREAEQHRRWVNTPEGRAKRREINKRSKAKRKGTEVMLILDAKRLLGLSTGIPMRYVSRDVAEAKALQLKARRAILDPAS